MAATVQGNTVGFYAVKQVSASSGVPANPVFTPLRRVSGDIDRNSSFEQSSEVDSTRQAAQQALTRFSVEGSQDGEFPVADEGLRLMIESAMQNPFSTDLSINASTISFDNATSEIRDSANGFTDVIEGQYIGVFNSASQTDSVFLVTSKTDDGVLVVSPSPIDEAEGATVDIKAQNVRNGKENQALTIQKRMETGSGTLYRTFEGCQVNSLSLNITASSIITSSISIIGLNQLDQTSAVTGQTDSTPSIARVIGSVNGVPTVFFDNEKIDLADRCYTDATIEIDNGGDGIYCIGSAGASSISFGSISVGGNLSSLVDGTDIASVNREKDLNDNETEFSIGIVLEDALGNKMVFHRPNSQYTALTQSNTANGDVLLNEGTISSNGKGTAGYTLQVTYIEAP